VWSVLKPAHFRKEVHLGWRYAEAELMKLRAERLRGPGTAYKNTVRLAYTRVKAYGAIKWYKWYTRQRYKIDAKQVPRKFREKQLITLTRTHRMSFEKHSKTPSEPRYWDHPKLMNPRSPCSCVSKRNRQGGGPSMVPSIPDSI
jgi:hypothetical protein